MALSEKEAFKVGFLLRCAESGLRPAPVIVAADALVKSAYLQLASDLAKPLAETSVSTLLAAGLGIPIAAGLGGGYLAHQATERPLDEDSLKSLEVSDEYRRLARIAKLNRKLKNLRSRMALA